MQSPHVVALGVGTFHRNNPLPGISQRSVAGLVTIAIDTLTVEPDKAPDFIDLTEKVEAFVEDSAIRHGQVTVHSMHTTAAVVVNEREPLLMEDAARWLDKLAPAGSDYSHDDFTVRTVNMISGESPNAHAHLQQLLLGSTQTIPVVDGRVALGQWQRIFLIELDQARPRQVLLQAMGLTG